MKTNELSGAALDWAVAKAEGATETAPRNFYGWDGALFSYSTNWAQGGKIVEREKISTWFCDEVLDAETDVMVRGAAWYAETFEGEHGVTGQTALIAAMRCYVASKLGDEIEVPKEMQ
jgi:hypothetical protein